ncbi:MAG: ABC transporter permease [Actinobacteria bacterium]|nr:ABC transporter permease [Actinomycetota bacterium]
MSAGSARSSTLLPSGPAGPERSKDRQRSGPLTGVGELVRLATRRDRMLLPIWIYVLAIIAVSGGYAVKEIYKTPASRASLASTVHHDAALLFIYGQLHGSSIGALLTWRYLTYAALAAGLMSIFLVIRHTRADEEAGRLELIGSTVVGRHAALTAALLVALIANAIALVLTFAIFMLFRLPAGGALAYALGEAGCGAVFAGIAAITAQVSSTARGARGIAITAVGVAFLLRGVGDSGGAHGLNWLSWVSPIGWAEVARPFTGERWWVFALPAAAAVVGIGAAFFIAGRRDAGAGLLPARPGPGAAGRLLAGPVGLTWRLERGSLVGWSTGFLVAGLAIGAVGVGIGNLIGSSGGAVDQALHRIGGQAALTNAYLAACSSLLGLVAAAYAVGVVLRLRTAETDGLSEPLLATPVSRYRWSGSSLLMTVAGTAVVLVAGGFGMGLAFGVAGSGPGTWIGRLVVAGLVQLPAALCLAALACAFVGVLPRWSIGIGWGAVAVCLLITVFGPAVQVSQAVLDVSPFTHVPKLPGGVFSLAPVIWLSVAAVAMAAVGVAGLRRRDIG